MCAPSLKEGGQRPWLLLAGPQLAAPHLASLPQSPLCARSPARPAPPCPKSPDPFRCRPLPPASGGAVPPAGRTGGGAGGAAGGSHGKAGALYTLGMLCTLRTLGSPPGVLLPLVCGSTAGQLCSATTVLQWWGADGGAAPRARAALQPRAAASAAQGQLHVWLLLQPFGAG